MPNSSRVGLISCLFINNKIDTSPCEKYYLTHIRYTYLNDIWVEVLVDQTSKLYSFQESGCKRVVIDATTGPQCGANDFRVRDQIHPNQIVHSLLYKLINRILGHVIIIKGCINLLEAILLFFVTYFSDLPAINIRAAEISHISCIKFLVCLLNFV